MSKSELLNKLIDFHGHLGPYLVLGYRMGIIGLRETGAKKYFGVQVSVRCPGRPPERCLIDGLQFSTGATYGKANICVTKFHDIINIIVKNIVTKKKVKISFNLKWYEQFKQELSPDEDKLHRISRKILTVPEKEMFCIIKNDK
ncbi:MAG: formylmethanofuran dehydrogenase subunit E family protein [bacterium]|nr:formylmethanofuran dehydrogenase subunit E family protein [bacterium]